MTAEKEKFKKSIEAMQKSSENIAKTFGNLAKNFPRNSKSVASRPNRPTYRRFSRASSGFCCFD